MCAHARYAGQLDPVVTVRAQGRAGREPGVPAPAAPRGPYEVIAESLREQIRTGQLKPGDQLPTIAELAVANTVAVGTAHRALSMLRNEGLIEVTRGRRAVVVLGQ